MKKKILSATFVVAMMMVAGYNVYMNQAKAGMSELALANVEALASNGEGTIFESTIKGSCEEQSIVYTGECHVVCGVCKTIWYPENRVQKAKATNVTGHCSCGNSNWYEYNL